MPTCSSCGGGPPNLPQYIKSLSTGEMRWNTERTRFDNTWDLFRVTNPDGMVWCASKIEAYAARDDDGIVERFRVAAES